MQSTRFTWFAARGPAVMAVVLAIIALATLSFGRENQRAIDWVSHTLDVQRELSGLSASLLAAMVSEREFIVTGDVGFLATMEQAQTTLAQRLVRLKVLTADNPPQRLLLGELQALIERRQATGQLTIDARRSSGFESASQIIVTRRELTELGLVQQKIIEMESAESTLLDARTSAAAVTLRVFLIAIVVGMLAVAAGLLYWWLQTRTAVAELARVNKSLSDSLVERHSNEDQIRQMQKMEAVGQLTGGIAHDFNNMLAIIIASLNLAQKRLAKGTGDIDKLLEGALDGAQRAAALTNRLLAFSRQQPLSPQTINLNRIVGGMSEMIARTLGEAGRVETVLAGGLWTTHVDAGQVENAVLNLCVNARDAMPDGGSLTIETANAHLDDDYARQHPGATAGQYVLIAVTDTGTGMAPEVAAKAFDPFFTTKAIGKGSGLGLSQVFGFVKQSGGHLMIYSEVGHGTTVKIYLPRSFGSEQAGQGASTQRHAEARELIRGDGRRLILVVEDESRVRGLTVATLRELGYTVIHAEDAVAALKQLDAHPDVALLFTDIVMPGMNGRKLADEAVRRQSHLKVLFTTGFTRNAVVHGGVLDAGVNFIAKPFTIEQLAAKVGEVVN